MKEEAVLFGETRSLIGIMTHPRTGDGSRKPGVILLNPGIVHRVAPGRLYVKLARALAAVGCAVLRFDFSGIGDSGVRHDHLPFNKSAVRETQDAMNWLSATKGIEHFILLGGCSGAQVALRTACCDARVVDAILMNFPLDEDTEGSADAEHTERSAAHYYWNFALFDLKSWRKLLTGRASYRNIIRVLKARAKGKLNSQKGVSAEALEFREQLHQLAGRDTQVMFAYAQDDLSVHELREAGGDELERLRVLGRTTLKVIPRADHTFSSLFDQERLVRVILDRLGSMTAPIVKKVRTLEQVTPSPI
ncbi:MAG TPA: alpha/beta fold hydrolase [Candidatus Acidoferrum sp.]|nr:alpha/beta fold hydrolase [Candidatus Acidoferrum sp.]